MRMTVGPLPPAVYWRRRVVVLGGLLLVAVLLIYSCGSSGKSDASSNSANGTSTPGPTSSALAGADIEPSTATESPTDAVSTSASPTAEASKGDAAPDDDVTASIDPTLCADDEMLITPVPASRQLPAGATLQLTIKIKNKSSRTCRRDVGADLQELYIVLSAGAQKVWSSDDCGGARGNNVEQFTPSFERAYTVTWNGRYSTTCTNQKTPTPGEYQLYGRLGTKRSAPVTLTLT